MGQGFWIALNLENAMRRPRWPWSCDGRQESGYEPGRAGVGMRWTTIRQADRWKYRGNCCWRNGAGRQGVWSVAMAAAGSVVRRCRQRFRYLNANGFQRPPAFQRRLLSTTSTCSDAYFQRRLPFKWLLTFNEFWSLFRRIAMLRKSRVCFWCKETQICARHGNSLWYARSVNCGVLAQRSDAMRNFWSIHRRSRPITKCSRIT